MKTEVPYAPFVNNVQGIFIFLTVVMEGIKQFIRNQHERLLKINVDKVYYRHLMVSPEVCITFKGKDYIKEAEDDYEILFDELVKLDVDPSVVPSEVWKERGSQKWGWEEI
jgi:hypothetical protein